MSENKLIGVYLTLDRIGCYPVNVPANINEVKLKGYLRDLGYISSYRRSYFTTKVYLLIPKDEVSLKKFEAQKVLSFEDLSNFQFKEICTDECRSLEELEIVEGSHLYIKSGESEPRRRYTDPGSMRALYGCPMAKSVEEAMNPAEKYFDSDSMVSTGFFGND